MTDDLLKRASAALREETADATDGARFTRARVMASLQQSQVRRRSRLAVLLPLAACFAAASAFGMVDGRVPAFVRSVTQSLGFGSAPSETPAPPPQKKSAPARSTESKPAPAIAAPLEPASPPAEAPPPETESPASTSSPKPTAPRTPARAATPGASNLAPKDQPEPSAHEATSASLSDISDRAHELYRVAHRSHFVDHDFVAALRAWDAYLEAAPNGRFVLEARYNRALCLIRVGRTNEARAALAPFATGQFGSYRQSEARSLIDAMNE
ncbi:MAG TPA: hypothetical protein VG937_31080 [Polyangiaceae bacterium]|jgi:hypothetical protein|nr:hypothetical protein [Polyangiaceae bacterium]